jgi:hypothetical protein
LGSGTNRKQEDAMARAERRSSRRAAVADNPKKATGDSAGASNRIKDPQDWVTGDEPMTGAQASYLKTLSEQAREPQAFDPALDKADASRRIDALKEKTGR